MNDVKQQKVTRQMQLADWVALAVLIFTAAICFAVGGWRGLLVFFTCYIFGMAAGLLIFFMTISREERQRYMPWKKGN